MADKIFPKGNLKKRSFLLSIIILIFGATVIVGLVAHKQKLTPSWKTYENLEFGCEIQYPYDWYVKEEYPQTNTKHIQWSKTISLGSVRIENTKERVIVYGDDRNPIIKFLHGEKHPPSTEKGSSFVVLVSQVTSDISSIEDWIIFGEKDTYDIKPKNFTPLEIAKGMKEEYKQQKEAWLKKRDERIQKNLKAVKEKKVGDIKIKAWEGYGWNFDPDSNQYLIYGIDFIHQGKFYRIRYKSGSQKQLKKDLDTFEKILASFKIT